MGAEPATAPVYPRELERSVTLRDGRPVTIRAIREDDAARLIALHQRLSGDTAYQRFFTAMRRLPTDWARMLATVDYERRLALVAERDTADGVELVAVGRYAPAGPADTAEVAFVVQDGWQGQGLGTVLFHDLLEAGRRRGVRRFVAYVLANNARMLDLITRFADVERRGLESGVVELTFTPRPPPARRP